MTFAIGFTGTRHGMTNSQRDAVEAVVVELTAQHGSLIAHHGDRVRADDEFDSIVGDLVGARIVVHPGPPSEWSAGHVRHERRDPLSYMGRNRNIVNSSTVIVAAPREAREVVGKPNRGGTWATIRLARRSGKPLAIVWPDGTVTKERWS